MINETVPLTISVSKIVAANLARRAAPMNIRASEYARRLFEVGYLARIAQERGEETGDHDLDRQVRNVFLLADCEPEFIAETLGLPVVRVCRIVEGWRSVASELLDGSRDAPAMAAAPIPTPPAAIAKAGRKPGPKGYTDDEIGVIRTMWREGRQVKEIAETLGKSAAGLQQWACKHRDVCPLRREGSES